MPYHRLGTDVSGIGASPFVYSLTSFRLGQSAKWTGQKWREKWRVRYSSLKQTNVFTRWRIRNCLGTMRVHQHWPHEERTCLSSDGQILHVRNFCGLHSSDLSFCLSVVAADESEDLCAQPPAHIHINLRLRLKFVLCGHLFSAKLNRKIKHRSQSYRIMSDSRIMCCLSCNFNLLFVNVSSDVQQRE